MFSPARLMFGGSFWNKKISFREYNYLSHIDFSSPSSPSEKQTNKKTNIDWNVRINLGLIQKCKCYKLREAIFRNKRMWVVCQRQLIISALQNLSNNPRPCHLCQPFQVKYQTRKTVFDISSQSKLKLRRKRRNKIVKI